MNTSRYWCGLYSRKYSIPPHPPQDVATPLAMLPCAVCSFISFTMPASVLLLSPCVHVHSGGNADILDPKLIFYGLYSWRVEGVCQCYGSGTKCAALPGLTNTTSSAQQVRWAFLQSQSRSDMSSQSGHYSHPR